MAFMCVTELAVDLAIFLAAIAGSVSLQLHPNTRGTLLTLLRNRVCG